MAGAILIIRTRLNYSSYHHYTLKLIVITFYWLLELCKHVCQSMLDQFNTKK